MARIQNPISKAASVVTLAQHRAEVADRAVARLESARAAALAAHAELDEARAAMMALVNPPANAVIIDDPVEPGDEVTR